MLLKLSIFCTIISICNSAYVEFLKFDDVNTIGNVVDLSGYTVHYFNTTMWSKLDDEFNFNIMAKEAENKVQTLYIMNSVTDMTIPKRAELMENQNNMFYFKKSNTSIYYDVMEKEWFEIGFQDGELDSIELRPFPELIPVTSCLDSSNGDGGSYGISYQIGLSTTHEIYGHSSLSVNNTALTLFASLGIDVSPSFSFQSSYTCNLKAGQYGQLFIEPFYIDVPRSYKKSVAYNKFHGIVANNEKYKEFKSFKLIAKHKPNHYCIIADNPYELDCKNSLAKESFILS